jgi:hypothetical protein
MRLVATERRRFRRVCLEQKSVASRDRDMLAPLFAELDRASNALQVDLLALHEKSSCICSVGDWANGTV